jgi:hypothetical protein
MFVKNSSSFVTACLLGVVGIFPAVAELPILTDREWLGYYVGHKTRSYQFGVTGQGETSIKVIGKKGEPLSQLLVSLDFVVDETMPDGQVVSRKVARETLSADAPAAAKLDRVVIKGKARGDTSVEIYMDENRGGIAIGGRIVDPGTCKNPLRFSVQLKFQNAYPKAKKDGKKELDAFAEQIKKDRIQLVSVDGKRSKPSPSEVLNAKEISGAGLNALAMELDPYQGKKFEITASDNSVMHLSNTTPGPLHEGFTVSWSVDPAKDPQNRARMEVLVK